VNLFKRMWLLFTGAPFEGGAGIEESRMCRVFVYRSSTQNSVRVEERVAERVWGVDLGPALGGRRVEMRNTPTPATGTDPDPACPACGDIIIATIHRDEQGEELRYDLDSDNILERYAS